MKQFAVWLVFELGIALSILPSHADDSARSSPPDVTQYARPAIPSDKTATSPAAPTTPTPGLNLMVHDDTVVNNTDPNLKNTDTFNDGETSIAINPNDHNEIVISAFSGVWSTYPSYSPIWLSHDSGRTWSKEFTITQPFGVSGTSGCPCDQTYDFGTLFVGGNPDSTVLFGTLLAEPAAGGALYTGDIFNPALVNNWAYWSTSSGSPSLATNLSSTDADQPWMLYNRGTAQSNNQNVYVAYGDFTTSPVNDRVSTSYHGDTPPQFLLDPVVGTSSGAINPGHRLAKDPRNGWMYSLYQNCITNCATLAANPKTIEYHLNRSTDQGVSWSLNGSTTGIVVASGLSTQPQPKFGTVNALLGGVDHAAVDPSTGDVYVVYGSGDGGGINNGLAIRRVFDNGSGGVTLGSPNFVVSGTIVAALPQVAVTSNGSVGVFYYTYNGMVSGFPQFSTWLAISTNQGATFNTRQLATFLSPATDNADPRQRVFGDYMQMKAADNCFYGSYTGNGAAFGRSISNNDPIFFKACVPGGAGTHDFSADGFSDILWRDTAGDVGMWLMNGAQILQGAAFNSVATNWSIVGQRDFNGDGSADILWRDTVGDVGMWLMNGTQIVKAGSFSSIPLNWSVAGTGDFNGDGKGDILWLDNQGNVGIWFMNGTQILQAGVVGQLPANWTIVGSDTKEEIFLRNTTSGDVGMWVMNGSQISQSIDFGSVALNWSVVGVGDFDGNGSTDILWRDTAGDVAIWLMNGTQILSATVLSNLPTSWKIAETGDFNGDGRADILWVDNQGNVGIWFMNGATVSSVTFYGNVGTNWSVQSLAAD